MAAGAGGGVLWGAGGQTGGPEEVSSVSTKWIETSRGVEPGSLTLHVEHAHFVRVRHGNVENYLVSGGEALRAFGPQDHLGHVLEVWSGGYRGG